MFENTTQQLLNISTLQIDQSADSPPWSVRRVRRSGGTWRNWRVNSKKYTETHSVPMGFIYFGQIIIFHQPRFSWNKGMSLPKRYLLGGFSVVWGRELIWPDLLIHVFVYGTCRKIYTTEWYIYLHIWQTKNYFFLWCPHFFGWCSSLKSLGEKSNV